MPGVQIRMPSATVVPQPGNAPPLVFVSRTSALVFEPVVSPKRTSGLVPVVVRTAYGAIIVPMTWLTVCSAPKLPEPSPGLKTTLVFDED